LIHEAWTTNGKRQTAGWERKEKKKRKASKVGGPVPPASSSHTSLLSIFVGLST
jgi:hypothetical protein